MYRALLLLASLAVTGCYSLGVGQDPRPLGPGGVRGSVGVHYQVESDVPYVQVGARVGVVDGSEVRVQMSFVDDHPGAVLQGLQAGVNVEAYAGDRFSLFLMPNYRLYRFVEDNTSDANDDPVVAERRVQAFAMPTLFVFDWEGQDMFLGPSLHLGARDQAAFFALGAHAGFSFHTPEDHLSITPEVSVMTGVLASVLDNDPYTRNRLFLPGSVMAELGLSMTFGSKHR